MKEQDGTFTGPDEASIYYRYWLPENSPRALVVIVHGAGEHCGRYYHLAAYLVEQGFAVASYDHPNHGQSSGTYGTVDSFDHYLKTLVAFQQQLADAFTEVPRILLGHSMGGLIATNYLVDHQDQFAACVLSGPAIKSDLQPGFLQMFLIRFLSRFFPTAGVLQLDSSGISRVPEEVARYDADPLVFHGKMSARMVSELFRGMDRIQARAAEITLPMLLLHGGADVMASPSGSVFLDENIGSNDKELHIFPGLFHEIFNEPEQDSIFVQVVAWINARVTR